MSLQYFLAASRLIISPDDPLLNTLTMPEPFLLQTTKLIVSLPDLLTRLFAVSFIFCFLCEVLFA